VGIPILEVVATLRAIEKKIQIECGDPDLRDDVVALLSP